MVLECLNATTIRFVSRELAQLAKKIEEGKEREREIIIPIPLHNINASKKVYSGTQRQSEICPDISESPKKINILYDQEVLIHFT